MSVGIGLINKIILEKCSLAELTSHGVVREIFVDDEKKVFDFIVSHYTKHGVYPKIETIERETGMDFPKFPKEPLSYWISAVEKRFQISIVARASKIIQEAAASGKLKDAINEVRTTYLRLQNRGAIDKISTLTQAAEKMLAQHDDLQKSGKLSGVPFGIPYLDEISAGAQPGDTVAICGRPGMGKTYIALNMANSAYNHGDTPLVATYEMSPEQCARRIIALRSRISATTIRLGKLSHWGRNKIIKNIGELKSFEDRPFYLMHGNLKSTVEDLVLRIQELRPTVVYVDGAYLLRTAGHNNSKWERVAETAEWLKMIASEFHIPIIATYQFNRRGPGSLSNIGGSDAIGQLASIVLGIDEEDSGEKRTFAARMFKILELLKGREGERGVIRMLYDMDRMRITQDEVVSGYVYHTEEGAKE